MFYLHEFKVDDAYEGVFIILFQQRWL